MNCCKVYNKKIQIIKKMKVDYFIKNKKNNLTHKRISKIYLKTLNF